MHTRGYSVSVDITKKVLYEKIINQSPCGNFFQSWAFGEFQKKIPYRGAAWTITSGDSSCLAIRLKMRLGLSWLWVPYGPIGEFDIGIFEKLAAIAKSSGAVFIRVEPSLNWDKKNTAKLSEFWKIRPALGRFTSDHTLILDLNKSQSELLKEMKPKGRYNIKVAEKHGVFCKQFAGETPRGDFDAFYEILKKTGNRDGFGVHPKFFYETLIKNLGSQNMSGLFLAYKKDSAVANPTVVAGAIAVFHKDTATYYYGASADAHKNLMAPYLLQWTTIKYAKEHGFKFYDFLGIAPADAKDHPWTGITAFKKKFGGREVTYPKAFSIVYRPFLYRILKFFRRLK